MLTGLMNGGRASANRNAKHEAPHAWTNGFLGVGGRLGADAVGCSHLPLVNDRLGYVLLLFRVGNTCSVCMWMCVVYMISNDVHINLWEMSEVLESTSEGRKEESATTTRELDR